MYTLPLALSGLLLLSAVANAAILDEKNLKTSLIVYEQGFALVHEEKQLHLRQGEKQLEYRALPQTIISDSINLTTPKEIQIHSQNYSYERLTQERLLREHLGKEVTLRRQKNLQEFENIPATLLSYDIQNSLLEISGKQIITAKNDALIFSKKEEGALEPSIVWNVSTPKRVQSKLTLEYLTNNIGFSTSYDLESSVDGSRLKGWVNIENNSGKEFKNVKLSLLSGELQRADNTPPPTPMLRTYAAMSSAPEVQEKAVAGYYLYDIPTPANIPNNQQTHIAFINEPKITTKKEYVATLSNPLYLRGERSVDVTESLALSPLAFALPKGKLRYYTLLQGKRVLLSQTEIAHTPNGQSLSFLVGKNFDLRVKESLTSSEQTQEYLQSTIRYTLSNHAKEAKYFTLEIPFNRAVGSKVTSKQKYRFTKGNFVTFSILVEVGQTQHFDVHFESRK